MTSKVRIALLAGGADALSATPSNSRPARAWTSVWSEWWRRRRQRWWLGTAVEVALLTVATIDAVPYGTTSWTWGWTWSTVAVAGLVFRRRWSVISCVACVPGLVVGYVVVAPLIATFTVADRARRGWVIAAAGLGIFGARLAGYQLNGISGLGSIALLQGIVYSAVLASGPIAGGLLVRARRRITAQYQQLAASQHRQQQAAMEAVLAEERAGLAREMHDVVSHQVSLIALQAAALRMTTTSESTRHTANTIRELAVRTLEELRAMVGVLRGSAALELAPQPRLVDVERLVADSGTGAELEWRIASSRQWPEAVERAAYRSVQEGLTNARKHAPGAATRVTISTTPDTLTVQVHNGPPAPTATALPRVIPPSGGHGLLGLRERAELLGGTLQAGPTASGGYTLTVTLRAA
jgi:signal transduction histidine kinase